MRPLNYNNFVFFGILVGVLYILPRGVVSKKILAVEFLGSKSHVLTYLPLLEELSRQGHEVTLVSPLQNMVKPGGIREHTTVEFQTIFSNLNISVFEMKATVSNPFSVLVDIAPNACGELYDREDIKTLMTSTFDLIILQPLFNECALGFVHLIMQRNDAPLILFSPMAAPTFVVSHIGGHHPPSFVPGIFTGFRNEMGFLERVQNFVMEITDSYIYTYYYLPIMNTVYREKLGRDLPSSKEILAKASLILSNAHFSISKPRPNLPNVVDVGGLHSRAPKPLPKDLEDFIAGSEDGFILVSFGTGIRSDDMSPSKRQIFLNAFSSLKQRVIWKFDTENIPGLPKNVLLKKWLPQQDLLGHPQIKMFVTHCGLGGIEEAIFHGVPLVGIPIFGDQPLNAKEAENHGFLVPLDWDSLTLDALKNAILEVLQNPKYRQNVGELSTLFKDQIDSPLKRAVWWTEYVMRHKGAPKLQSAARNLNFVQYHSLDVVVFLVAVVAVTLYGTIKLILLSYANFFQSGQKLKYQ